MRPSADGRTHSSTDTHTELFFRELVLTARRPARAGLGWRISVATHVALVLALLLVPLFWPAALPDVAAGHMVAFAFEPGPPPPPPPGGNATRSSRTVRVVPSRAVEAVTPTLETPVNVEAQPSPPVLDAPASGPVGEGPGDPDGMAGGQAGGQVGGVPDGQLGGCVTCFGEGAVRDYDQGPQLVSQTRPAYPQEAFVRKVEGTVVLEILIDASGNVTDARVTRSIPEFDAAARACVLAWKFKPARRHGQPVATLAVAPVSFRIY